MSKTRERLLLREAHQILQEAFDDPDITPEIPELHIFDFDETLAYTPNGEWKLFFGHYTDGFQSTNAEEAQLAIDLALQAGIKPVKIVDTKSTRYMLLDFSGYEAARGKLNKAWREKNFADLPQKGKQYGTKTYMKPMSLFFTFPEDHQKAADQYQTLPCLDIMRAKLGAGIPCYICTARAGDKEIVNIKEFLEYQGVKLPTKNIFAVGSENKGLTVNSLIDRHNPKKVWFYDDSSRNCSDVKETCCSTTKELHIMQLSRSVPGEIIDEFICGGDAIQETVHHRSRSRSLFRNWRRLGGI